MLAGFGATFGVMAWPVLHPAYREYMDGHVLSIAQLLLPALVSAFILVGARRLSWIGGALAPAAAVPAIIMTRVVMDCWSDPTNHNLWPFEVIPAGVVGLAGGFAGAAAGIGIRWFIRKYPPVPQE